MNGIDWEAVEREYRAGQLSVSEIARLSNCSHTAINKRAKRDGWTRDLAARVRQEVSARLVSEQVSAANVRETIELAAERDIKLIREHRADIGQGRAAVKALFAELNDATSGVADIKEEIISETASDKNAKRRASMLAAVSLAGRAGVAASLSTAMRNLVGLERQAFGLSNTPEAPEDGASSLAAALDALRPRNGA